LFSITPRDKIRTKINCKAASTFSIIYTTCLLNI
jgi:hypothetical protein